MRKRRSSAAPSRALTRAVSRLATSSLKAGTRLVGTMTQNVLDHAAEQMRPPPGAGDWLAGFAVGPGGTRRYHLFRPHGIGLREQRPLLVMLHGCGQTGREFALSTRMNQLAARERFLVLYPEQDRRKHPQGCWDWYATRSGQAYAEMGTLLAVIDQVVRLYPVDPEAVGVAGLSAGAGMAALLAHRQPRRFCAVAMHSGVAPGSANSTASAIAAMLGTRELDLAAPSHALPPLLVLHGTRDGVVAPANGAAAAYAWAETSGARAAPAREVRRGNRYACEITDFRLRGALCVQWVAIEGLGHAWSGGAQQKFSDPRGPDASKMVWRFMQRCLSGSLRGK